MPPNVPSHQNQKWRCSSIEFSKDNTMAEDKTHLERDTIYSHVIQISLTSLDKYISYFLLKPLPKIYLSNLSISDESKYQKWRCPSIEFSKDKMTEGKPHLDKNEEKQSKATG